MLEDGNIVAWGAEEAEEDGEAVGVRQRWSDAHRKARARNSTRTLFKPAGCSEMSRNASRWQSLSRKRERVQCETVPPLQLPQCCEMDLDMTPHPEHSGRPQNSHEKQVRRDAKALVQRVSCTSHSRPASRPSFRLVALKAMHSIWTGLKASLHRHSGESVRIAPAALPGGEKCVCVPPSQRVSRGLSVEGRERRGRDKGRGNLTVVVVQSRAWTVAEVWLVYITGNSKKVFAKILKEASLTYWTV